MKKKTLIAICILLSLSVVFCSCGKEGGKEKETTPHSYENTGEVKTVDITLPYSSSDSLNPFFATGTYNSAAAFLFCQPLFEVKSDYSPEAIIADTYTIDENKVTLTIKSMRFSDGSEIGAKDVVYSFNKAKQSPAYSERLKNVQSAERSGASVVFTLASPDAYVLNILTFPVVKSDTAETADSIPTGSGLFSFSDSETLTVNSYSQISTDINTVRLYDVKQPDYITNQLEIGNINYLFEDFSEGNYKRIVAGNKTVTLNNLVYLGMNSGAGALSSAAVRTAVYYAVDKEEVSATAYQGYSKAAATVFNPDFYGLSDVSVPNVRGDKQKSASILEKLGYNRYSKSGALTNGTNELKFSILVNSENAFRVSAAYKIAENLYASGIMASVEEVNSAVYQQRIASGDFQMYIGEVKLTENMDMSVFISGSASAGIDKSVRFISDYSAFREGTIGVGEIVDSFMNDVIFVPICYRCGMAAYSKAFTPDFTYAPYNIYGNIENWEKAE